MLEEWKINGWLSSSYGGCKPTTWFTSLIGMEKEKQGAHLLSVRLGAGGEVLGLREATAVYACRLGGVLFGISEIAPVQYSVGAQSCQFPFLFTDVTCRPGLGQRMEF